MPSPIIKKAKEKKLVSQDCSISSSKTKRGETAKIFDYNEVLLVKI